MMIQNLNLKYEKRIEQLARFGQLFYREIELILRGTQRLP
jgi:hypothetical protein